MTTRTKTLLVLAATLSLTVATTAVAAKLGAERTSFDAAHSNFTPNSVRAFEEFPLYSPGDDFEGMPLKAIVRRVDQPYPGEAVTANFVSFAYGDCSAASDEACPLPLEVQIWPACERSPADYALTPGDDALPREELKVRGVPAAFFEEGLRLELYTGNVTVVVFGLDREQIARAARALKGVNRALNRGQNMPPPFAGAMEGRLACGA